MSYALKELVRGCSGEQVHNKTKAGHYRHVSGVAGGVASTCVAETT